MPSYFNSVSPAASGIGAGLSALGQQLMRYSQMQQERADRERERLANEARWREQFDFQKAQAELENQNALDTQLINIMPQFAGDQPLPDVVGKSKNPALQALIYSRRAPEGTFVDPTAQLPGGGQDWSKKLNLAPGPYGEPTVSATGELTLPYMGNANYAKRPTVMDEERKANEAQRLLQQRVLQSQLTQTESAAADAERARQLRMQYGNLPPDQLSKLPVEVLNAMGVLDDVIRYQQEVALRRIPQAQGAPAPMTPDEVRKLYVQTLSGNRDMLSRQYLAEYNKTMDDVKTMRGNPMTAPEAEKKASEAAQRYYLQTQGIDEEAANLTRSQMIPWKGVVDTFNNAPQVSPLKARDAAVTTAQTELRVLLAGNPKVNPTQVDAAFSEGLQMANTPADVKAVKEKIIRDFQLTPPAVKAPGTPPPAAPQQQQGQGLVQPPATSQQPLLGRGGKYDLSQIDLGQLLADLFKKVPKSPERMPVR